MRLQRSPVLGRSPRWLFALDSALYLLRMSLPALRPPLTQHVKMCTHNHIDFRACCCARRLKKEEAERALGEQLKVLSGELSIKDEALEELAEEMERLRLEQESKMGKDSEKLSELEVGCRVLACVRACACARVRVLPPSKDVLVAVFPCHGSFVRAVEREAGCS
jgi:hypothetical protein